MLHPPVLFERLDVAPYLAVWSPELPYCWIAPARPANKIPTLSPAPSLFHVTFSGIRQY